MPEIEELDEDEIDKIEAEAKERKKRQEAGEDEEEDPAEEQKKEEPKSEEKVEEEEPISDDEPETLDEEDPDTLPEDQEPFPEKGPVGEIELSDEQMDKQGDFKSAGVDAAEDGNLEKAVEKYTEAIKIGNASAMMYAKRAEMLLKLKKPCAAIASADAALEVNADSAKSYRVRGKAHRLLGHWEQAHLDLSTAQKLDFDDATEDLHKFVDGKFKQVAEKKNRNRIRGERRKVRDNKRKKAEAVRAYEAQKKADAEGGGMGYGGMGGMGGGGMPAGMEGMFGGGGMPPGMAGMFGGGGMPPGMEGLFGGGGMPAGMEGMFGGKGGGKGGMPGGMGGMPGGGMPGGGGGMPGGMDPAFLQGLMSDPDLMAAMSNPKVMAAMQDLMANPGNISKYENDPEMMALMQKLQAKMGGGGMPGGGGGAAPAPTVEECGADEVD